MTTKPSDIFLGVIDLFAVLLPGLLLATLLSDNRTVLLDGFGISEPSGTLWLVVSYAVASYVLGHLMRALGEPLDRALYDRFYVPAFKRHTTIGNRRGKAKHILETAGTAIRNAKPKSEPEDALLDRAEELAGAQDVQGIRRNTFSWAEEYVRIRSHVAFQAVERLIADSKFFRSLLILSIAAIPIAAVNGAVSLQLVIVVVLIGLLAASQYLRLRWKATNLLYQSFVMLVQDPTLGDGRTDRPSAA